MNRTPDLSDTRPAPSYLAPPACIAELDGKAFLRAEAEANEWRDAETRLWEAVRRPRPAWTRTDTRLLWALLVLIPVTCALVILAYLWAWWRR